MNIRKAKTRDVPEVAKLNYELNTYHLKFDKYYELKKNTDSLSRKYYRTIIRSNRALLMVAEVNNRVVGYICCKIEKRPPIYKINERGYIGGLFVSKKHRRKGIGKKLVAEALKWFKEKGIFYVETEADVRNKLSVPSWKSYNFRTFQIKIKKNLSK